MNLGPRRTVREMGSVCSGLRKGCEKDGYEHGKAKPLEEVAVELARTQRVVRARREAREAAAREKRASDSARRLAALEDESVRQIAKMVRRLRAKPAYVDDRGFLIGTLPVGHGVLDWVRDSEWHWSPHVFDERLRDALAPEFCVRSEGVFNDWGALVRRNFYATPVVPGEKA